MVAKSTWQLAGMAPSSATRLTPISKAFMLLSFFQSNIRMCNIYTEPHQRYCNPTMTNNFEEILHECSSHNETLSTEQN